MASRSDFWFALIGLALSCIAAVVCALWLAETFAETGRRQWIAYLLTCAAVVGLGVSHFGKRLRHAGRQR